MPFTFTKFRLSRGGIAELLIAIGIVGLLGMMSLTQQLASGLTNQHLIERLNVAEAFYMNEVLAWHAYERQKANLPVDHNSWGVVQLDNQYMNRIELSQDTYNTEAGMPLNVATTRDYAPSSTIVRRYFPERYGAGIDSKASSCGRVGFGKGKKNYRLCLSGAPTESMGPAFFFGVVGTEGKTLWKFSGNGQLDTAFGNQGKLQISNPFSSTALLEVDFPVAVKPDESFIVLFSQGLQFRKADGSVDTSKGNNGLLETKHIINAGSNNSKGGFELPPEYEYHATHINTSDSGNIMLFPIPLNHRNELLLMSNGTTSPTDNVKRVQRVLENGTFDQTFGTNGEVTFSREGSIDTFNCYDAGNSYFCRTDSTNQYNVRSQTLVKLDRTGRFDQSFGTNGSIALDARKSFDGFALASDGFFHVLELYTYNSGHPTSIISHYKANGEKDLSFGTGGSNEILGGGGVGWMSAEYGIHSVKFRCVDSRIEFYAYHHSLSGIQDMSFGINGTAIIYRDDQYYCASDGENTINFSSISIDKSGAMYTWFEEVFVSDHRVHYLFFRNLPSGARDSHFGNNGMVDLVTDSGSKWHPFVLVPQ